MTTAKPANAVVDLADFVATIPDGASIALAPDYSGCAMAAVAALVRLGRRDLHLVGVPSLGLQADWLIGAGAVRSIETAALTLGEAGMPPRAVAAIKAGTLAKDATCPALHAGLQAAEKGIPFMPLRGILGSDLLAYRDDWKVIDNPFKAGEDADPIVLVPAIRPDFALFHAAVADSEGNVFIGVRRELMLMAHAARRTLVTVEHIEDRDLLRDDATAAGTIPALYVSAIAEAPRGADPVGLAGSYPADAMAVAEYVAAAKADEGFQSWCERHIHARETA
jgi:glutaconate CoA-transferase subunit A